VNFYFITKSADGTSKPEFKPLVDPKPLTQNVLFLHLLENGLSSNRTLAHIKALFTGIVGLEDFWHRAVSNLKT
jgi:hypothetical protein